MAKKPSRRHDARSKLLRSAVVASELPRRGKHCEGMVNLGDRDGSGGLFSSADKCAAFISLATNGFANATVSTSLGTPGTFGGAGAPLLAKPVSPRTTVAIAASCTKFAPRCEGQLVICNLRDCDYIYIYVYLFLSYACIYIYIYM